MPENRCLLPFGRLEHMEIVVGGKARAGWAIRRHLATLGEAQQYLLQQVAKQHDPQAGYSPNAKRIISSLITGTALGVPIVDGG
jgi:hypothetical protein